MRVKICGLTRREDARVAAQAGADVLGAVLVPSSPRVVTPQDAAGLAEAAERPLAIVVADLPLARLLEVARSSRARILQLHGGESPALLGHLRGEGSWELWKAVRVRTPDEIRQAVAGYAGVADALLLDGWHPRQLGGTGTSFPWKALEVLRGEIPPELQVGVAGGLNPGNVAEAVRLLHPDIVDVSSGVEARPGVKDPEAVAAFVREARGNGSERAPGPQQDEST